MNSNPASVGSGDCSRRDEAPQRCFWYSIPDPSRRQPSRSALRSSLAVRGVKAPCWCRLGQTHYLVLGDKGPRREPPAIPSVRPQHKDFAKKVLPKLHGSKRVLGDSLKACDPAWKICKPIDMKATAAFLGGGHSGSNPAAQYSLRLGQTVGIGSGAALALPNGGGPERVALRGTLLGRAGEALLSRNLIALRAAPGDRFLLAVPGGPRVLPRGTRAFRAYCGGVWIEVACDT
jgi:hypothetical protein